MAIMILLLYLVFLPRNKEKKVENAHKEESLLDDGEEGKEGKVKYRRSHFSPDRASVVVNRRPISPAAG